MANSGTYNHTKVHFAEGSAAATPDAGEVVIYAKTDGLLYSKDDAGAETLVSGGVGGGGGVAADPIWDTAGDLAVGSGANTAARLAKGSDGTNLRMVSGSVAWSGVGSLLDHTVYEASNITYNQTSATLGDADATNLTVVFTAPASGTVLVRLTGVARQPSGAAAGARAYWGLRESTTIVAGPMFVLYAPMTMPANRLEAASCAFYITGLTPGNSYTYKWAIAGDGTYGGGLYVTTGSPAFMEVWGL